MDGLHRTYRLYLPASLPVDRPVPLVLMLHGGFGNGEQAERAYGWNAKADREGFAVAYPDGLHRAWSVGGGCCGVPGRQGVDDVAFLTTVVAEVGRLRPIDPARVYATGISNGGMMAYRLACDTDLFAAIGPDATTLLGDCPNPAPTSVIHIHGLADQSVRYDGSPGTGVARIDGPPVESVIAQWRKAASCPEPSVSREGRVTRSVADCPDGRAVQLITIDGAGHQWPGAEPQRREGADPPATDIDATDEIWHFFADHPRAS